MAAYWATIADVRDGMDFASLIGKNVSDAMQEPKLRKNPSGLSQRESVAVENAMHGLAKRADETGVMPLRALLVTVEVNEGIVTGVTAREVTFETSSVLMVKWHGSGVPEGSVTLEY